MSLSEPGMSMRSFNTLLIGTYDLLMHLLTMVVSWPMESDGLPSNMEK